MRDCSVRALVVLVISLCLSGAIIRANAEDPEICVLGQLKASFSKDEFSEFRSKAIELLKARLEGSLAGLSASRQKRVMEAFQNTSFEKRAGGGGGFDPISGKTEIDSSYLGKIAALDLLVHEWDHSQFFESSAINNRLLKLTLSIGLDPRSLLLRTEAGARGANYDFVKDLLSLEQNPGDLSRILIKESGVPEKYHDLIFQILRTARPKGARIDFSIPPGIRSQIGKDPLELDHLADQVRKLVAEDAYHLLRIQNESRGKYVYLGIVRSHRDYGSFVAMGYAGQGIVYGLIYLTISHILADASGHRKGSVTLSASCPASQTLPLQTDKVSCFPNACRGAVLSATWGYASPGCSHFDQVGECSDLDMEAQCVTGAGPGGSPCIQVTAKMPVSKPLILCAAASIMADAACRCTNTPYWEEH